MISGDLLRRLEPCEAAWRYGLQTELTHTDWNPQKILGIGVRSCGTRDSDAALDSDILLYNYYKSYSRYNIHVQYRKHNMHFSSWWRTPISRALPYWRPDAKYLAPLPSSMLCEPRSSVTVCPPQSFSAKWFLDDRRVSSSQMADIVRQWWHDGGLPQDSTRPGARRTSTGRTWPFQRLASSL